MLRNIRRRIVPMLADAVRRIRTLRWKSRYTRSLEAELAQLRAECARVREENRALLNSILGIAGIPPILTTSAEAPRSHPSPRSGPEAPAAGPVPPLPDANAPAGVKNLAQVATPLRRRSWQQINRALEFEAARKNTPQEIPEA